MERDAVRRRDDRQCGRRGGATLAGHQRNIPEQVQATHPTAEFDAQFFRPGAGVSPDDFVRSVYEDFTRRR